MDTFGPWRGVELEGMVWPKCWGQTSVPLESTFSKRAFHKHVAPRARDNYSRVRHARLAETQPLVPHTSRARRARHDEDGVQAAPPWGHLLSPPAGPYDTLSHKLSRAPSLQTGARRVTLGRSGATCPQRAGMDAPLPGSQTTRATTLARALPLQQRPLFPDPGPQLHHFVITL